MGATTLKDETITLIREDVDLYADICKLLKKAPAYLPVLLRKKDDQLTQMSVLQLISAHTGKAIEDLYDGKC